METTKLPVSLILLSMFLMSVIFVIDLQLPLGVAGGIPYIAVVLISLWFQNKNYAIGFAITCTVLILIGFYFSPFGGELWKVLANRILAILAIWTTVTLAIKWKRTQEKILLIKSKAEKEQEKKEIYMATMHAALHITNNLLNQLLLVKMEIEKHEDFSKDVLDSFDNMMLEAGTLLAKLSAVKDIEADNIMQSVYPR
ncbi:MAG: hypothetical protein OQK75_13495 [Gammaproteobacteria bacterium]|nr:hypothetical protein [Gammaproteobacteria bacterium]MCW8988673.1 hypothetical protein [Gammaproteobacteria bacterium]MCW9030991.1 hypothetical protein [Gammaproteobacteria bacterium]